MISAPSNLASANKSTLAVTESATSQQPASGALEQYALGFGQTLPTETLLQIAQLLSIDDFMNLAQTNRASYALMTTILLELFRPKCNERLLKLFQSKINCQDPEEQAKLKERLGKQPELLIHGLYKLISGKQARKAFESQRIKFSFEPVKYSLDFQISKLASRVRSRIRNFKSESDKNTFQEHRLFQDLMSHAFLKPLIGFVPKTADIILSGNRELKRQDLEDLNMSQELPDVVLSASHARHIFNNLVVISTQPCNPNFKAFVGIPKEELELGIAGTSSDAIRALMFTSGLFYRPVNEFGQPLYVKEALYWAAANNKPERVEEILKADVSINVMSREGGSALHGAVANGHKEMSESLIQQGISLESRDENGFTPFLLAARYQSITMVKFLLDICDYMADDSQQDPTGKDLFKFSRNTPNSNYLLQQCTQNGRDALYLAAESGDIEKVEYFVKRGLYLEPLKDEKSQSAALLPAIRSKCVKAVELLLKGKARPDHPMYSDRTALLKEAIFTNDFNMFQLFVPRMEDALKKHRPDLLQSAVRVGNIDVAVFFIQPRTQEEAQKVNTDDNFLLYVATDKSDIDMLRFLALYMPNQFNEHKHELLGAAVDNNCIEIVEFLIDQGAPLSSDDVLWTPLHCAVDKGYLEIVQLLVESKAEINVSSGQDTPLSIAVSKEDFETVAFLVGNGAWVDMRCGDTDSMTPLSMAIKYGFDTIFDALIASEEFDRSCSRGNFALLEQAYREGRYGIAGNLLNILIASPDFDRSCSPRNFALLEQAYRAGQHDVVTNLIAQLSGKESIALSTAVLRENTSVVNLLLQYDYNWANNLFLSDLIITAVENNFTDIAKNLIAKLNGREFAALRIAITQQNTSVVNLLLHYDYNWANNLILNDLITLAQGNTAIVESLLNASASELTAANESNLAENELGSNIIVPNNDSDEEWEE